MKLSYKIIIGLLSLGFLVGINPLTSRVYGANEDTPEEVKPIHIQAENVGSQHEDVGEAHREEHAASSEHGHSEEHRGGGEHEGEHHIWWTFPGYEIVLGILSCIYFALFIVIVPYFFGTDLEEHH